MYAQEVIEECAAFPHGDHDDYVDSVTQAIMTPSRWNAQYMQEPTSDEGALIKREWWQDWDSRTSDRDWETRIQGRV
jgi:hypothetical protein